MVAERNEHVALGVVGADTADGDIAGNNAQTGYRPGQAVGRNSGQSDRLSFGQPQPDCFGGVDEQYVADPIDSPEAVVIANPLSLFCLTRRVYGGSSSRVCRVSASASRNNPVVDALAVYRDVGPVLAG